MEEWLAEWNKRALDARDGEPETTAYAAAVNVEEESRVLIFERYAFGQRSLKIHENQPLDRKLVGFYYPSQTELPLPDECNLIIADGQIAGRVTSIAHRSTLGHPLGLAHVRPELAETGTTITIRTDSGALSHCQIADTPFYDPEGERQLVP